VCLVVRILAGRAALRKSEFHWGIGLLERTSANHISRKSLVCFRAAFIADRFFSKDPPATILSPYPRRKRRGRCSATALTMAVTNPISLPGKLKYETGTLI
jgi:hypothetical protein